jgi:hypothetical protein
VRTDHEGKTEQRQGVIEPRCHCCYEIGWNLVRGGSLLQFDCVWESPVRVVGVEEDIQVRTRATIIAR